MRDPFFSEAEILEFKEIFKLLDKLSKNMKITFSLQYQNVVCHFSAQWFIQTLNPQKFCNKWPPPNPSKN